MTEPARYHPGEHYAQHRAGLREAADISLRAIGTTIPPVAAAFIADQPMLVLGAADAAGRMWASLLTGPPGFVAAPDDNSLDIRARPLGVDPLAQALAAPVRVGMIAVEPKTRRRVRINGRAEPTSYGLHVSTDQVYSNCPKYIQQRSPHVARERAVRAHAAVSESLTDEQCALIADADTFFVATRSAAGDADASHRGGDPGFVQVLAPNALRWPDYIGNAMMMTLGNLQQDPSAGLLFIGWNTGQTLQVTGTARVDWDPGPGEGLPGAQRVVNLNIDHVVQVEHATALTWSEPRYSRFNPSLTAAIPEGAQS